MLRVVFDILIKPVWKWVVVVPIEIVGGITFFFPDLQPILNWPSISNVFPWYWWVVLGAIVFALVTAVAAAKRVHEIDNLPRKEDLRQEAAIQSKPLSPRNVRFGVSPNEKTKDGSPHIAILVTNEQDMTLFCRAPCHAIYDSSGENIKRDISEYANHFSWAGGSDGGTKEIPAELDGTVNLVKTNRRGYGIAFLFDENPYSYWKTEGVYRIELAITGEIEEGSARVEFIDKKINIEFEYIKNEIQSNTGEIVNNSELRLLTWDVL